jgi:hypothetical protein
MRPLLVLFAAGALVPDARAQEALPPVQFTNQREARLRFEVAKLGPSGLGGVDVYLTTDDGRTWQRAPLKPPATLPLAGRARLRGTVVVPLEREGVVHGFYVVAHSGAGLGKGGPRPGDVPQIRVEVDTTPPQAKLFQPRPDPARRERLLLTWEASDKNLTADPASLEWAARPEGPWAQIGVAQLPHTGSYSWDVPPGVPPEVYVRLSVRDAAGNVTVTRTEVPVPTDFCEPEVRVLGLGRESR